MQDEEADQACAALLALATYAHNGVRPLVPARVHLMFRGIPTLYACINPRCEKRRHRPGEELLLGRLYTEPRTHCDCEMGARVYELYTHRDCGAAYLRVFGDGDDADFYWHEQGGSVGHVARPLDESLLLVENLHPAPANQNRVVPILMDITTGKVITGDPDSTDLRYRRFFRLLRQQNARSPFPYCPACTKRSGDKIMSLGTTGEQPFANLVREQFASQAGDREPSDRYPNAGRKVLLFSDGRQKAARLARDLPREVEFDTFRQALSLAVHRLGELGKPATTSSRLYKAFVSVCSDFNLVFFDGPSQEALLGHIREFNHDFRNQGLNGALADEEWSPSLPDRYKLALLRQMSDPYYSLYSSCTAVTRVSPRAGKGVLNRLREIGLDSKIGETVLGQIATTWVQLLLDKGAFDKSLRDYERRQVMQYFDGIRRGEPLAQLDDIIADSLGLDADEQRNLRELLYDSLTEAGQTSVFLDPSKLALELAIDRDWFRCRLCGLTQQEPLLGRCFHCGSQEIDAKGPDDPYIVARKGYLLEPIRKVLGGARLFNITAEEHTAQLSHRDFDKTWATTEEFELRFQNVTLNRKPPVDILSCTTTMEVGVDIGSLTGVGLRNIPPQRENYQQRSGRAGRRGSALASVITFSQGGPHDNYYYEHPYEIISGEPRRPQVNVDNPRLARRHVHSYMVQAFFHGALDRLGDRGNHAPRGRQSNLFSSLGTTREFFTTHGPLSFEAFKQWCHQSIVSPNAEIAQSIVSWLPDGLCATQVPAMDPVVFVQETIHGFVESLASLWESIASDGQNNGNDPTQTPLLDALFDNGLLPSYAFPRDVCTFYVFDGHGDIEEKPQQGMDKALSEYAPGRLLVINKQTYRVGGIFTEGERSETPAERFFRHGLPVYVYCPTCTFIRISSAEPGDEHCPICGTQLQGDELLRPPGFAPESARSLDEQDRDQEMSYATTADFPVPSQPEQFLWSSQPKRPIVWTHQQDRELVMVNRGPLETGFAICELCGAAWPSSAAPVGNSHDKPFLVKRYPGQHAPMFGRGRCNGRLRNVYLGYRFLTDLLVLQLPIPLSLSYDPQAVWLHDALRTMAEAMALGASRQLDIDPGELSAGYRFSPAGSVGTDCVGAADVYLYDTASGGAGYAAEAGRSLEDVVRRSLELLRNCPENCETSCTKCLRHYGNRYWHGRLDRYLGAQLLDYAWNSTIPHVSAIEDQSTMLRPLQRYLELEGWETQRDAVVGSLNIPLMITKANHQGRSVTRNVAVGVYPALLNPDADGFTHPLDALDSIDDVSSKLLRDYIVSRDLPTAYRELCDLVGF